MENPAVALAVLAAGVFFLVGLLTGAWKYRAMMRSERAVAPTYVDVAHRASLLYSFAALLLAVTLALFWHLAQLVVSALGFAILALGPPRKPEAEPERERE